MPIFKSGAFLQQCFSVHPLCLSIKKVVAPAQVILSCSSCNLTHRVTVRSLTSRLASPAETAEGTEGPGVEALASCAEAHPMAVRVNAMDVLHDAVGLRCRDCRRTFDIDVALLETRQR